MGGFNPCGCWNLKDGCVTVGIWSILFCIIQFGLFGWQTAAVKDQKDISSNLYLGYDRPYAGDQDRYYEQTFYSNRDSRFWTGLFVVQILILIVTFFLLFASVALIYGIHTDSKYLVWPWFPCSLASILCAFAYCILWWAGDVQSYWMALTIVEMLAAIVNIYALVCVMAYYGRIGREEQNQKRYAQGFNGNVMYDPNNEQNTFVYFDPQSGQQIVQPMPEQQQLGYGYDQPAIMPQYADGGFVNTSYAPDQQPQKVRVAGATQPLPYQQAEPLPPKTQQNVTWEEHLKYHVAPQQQNPVTQPLPPAEAMQPEAAWTQNWLQTQPRFPQDNQGYIAQTGNSGAQTDPNTPILPADASAMRPVESAPEFDGPDKRDRDRKHKHSRHRSNSVRSKRSRRRYDSDSGESDDESRRHRSRHRHDHSRSRSHSRDHNRYAASETDTAYSRSTHKHSHNHRSHRHNHRDYDDEDRHRPTNMRDVKRRNGNGRPDTGNSTTPNSTVSRPLNAPLVRPPGANGAASPGAITIPQKIIIPASKGNKNKEPQKFHINSEIVISYSDRSTNASETDLHKKRTPGVGAGGARGALPTAGHSGVNRNPDPTITSPTDDERRPHSFGNDSSDSKGYGSTAV